MRCASFLLMILLYSSPFPAFAMEVLITNATPYEILGLFLEGVSDGGQEISSYSTVRARPGESCGERNGNMDTLNGLQVDFGLGRVVVKQCALKGRLELTLRMDEQDKALLSTSDGQVLPLVFSDLRYGQEDENALDFMELVQMTSREDVLGFGKSAVLAFREIGDLVMPVRLGDTVWTGTVSFASDASLARIRLMTDKSSEEWKDILPDFLEAFDLRPLSLALPNGDTIRYWDKSDANAADNAKEAREQLVSLVTNQALLEENPEGTLWALMGGESAFAACGQPQGELSPSLGAVLQLSASNLVILDVEKNIRGRVLLEHMR